jgi:LacI family transcriptional regulator
MTIVDIAKEAGYSVSTVSRVLNGRRDVSVTALCELWKLTSLYQITMPSI